jgi:hypothetical protein
VLVSVPRERALFVERLVTLVTVVDWQWLLLVVVVVALAMIWIDAGGL